MNKSITRYRKIRTLTIETREIWKGLEFITLIQRKIDTSNNPTLFGPKTLEINV